MKKFKQGEVVKFTPYNGYSPVVAYVHVEKKGYRLSYDAVGASCVVRAVTAYLTTTEGNKRLSRDMAGAEGFTRPIA